MATPLMPYGFQFVGSESGSLTPAYSEASLPSGIVMLHITWDAPQGVIINRSAARVWQAKVEIGRIAPGAGRRGIMIPGIAVTGNTFLSIDRMDGTPVPVGATLAVVVHTIPFS